MSLTALPTAAPTLTAGAATGAANPSIMAASVIAAVSVISPSAAICLEASSAAPAGASVIAVFTGKVATLATVLVAKLLSTEGTDFAVEASTFFAEISCLDKAATTALGNPATASLSPIASTAACVTENSCILAASSFVGSTQSFNLKNSLVFSTLFPIAIEVTNEVIAGTFPVANTAIYGIASTPPYK